MSMHDDTAQKSYGRSRSLSRCRYRHLLILILAAGPSCCQTVDAEKAEVLILHSYHSDMDLVELEQDGIESVFKEGAPVPVELRIEHMDAKRPENGICFDYLADLYRYKYQSTPPNVIIACDEPAFESALAGFDESKNGERIIDQVRQIDAIVAELDSGRIESENVRQFLHRNYGLDGRDLPPDDRDTGERDS